VVVFKEYFKKWKELAAFENLIQKQLLQIAKVGEGYLNRVQKYELN